MDKNLKKIKLHSRSRSVTLNDNDSSKHDDSAHSSISSTSNDEQEHDSETSSSFSSTGSNNMGIRLRTLSGRKILTAARARPEKPDDTTNNIVINVPEAKTELDIKYVSPIDLMKDDDIQNTANDGPFGQVDQNSARLDDIEYAASSIGKNTIISEATTTQKKRNKENSQSN